MYQTDDSRKYHQEITAKSDWYQELELWFGNVVTPDKLRLKFLGAKKGKAFGEDLIPNELVKLAPDLFAMHIAPIAAKAALRLGHPVQWGGGTMQELFKGSGSAKECANSRGILLSSGTGKGRQRQGGRVV